MDLSRAEQKSRRALAKSVATELRSRAKGTDWKVSQGWLFREDASWFVDVRASVWAARRKSTLQLFSKPMGIDPIFWDIVATPDNIHQPLSFRLFGAWTVSTPSLSEVEVEEVGLDAPALADTILQVAQREFELSREGRSLEGLLARVREHPAHVRVGGYLPAMVCGLVLLGRREEAREACIAARERRESGGFSVGSRTFVDLALEWLVKTEPVRH
jgi:hypothetical protein